MTKLSTSDYNMPQMHDSLDPRLWDSSDQLKPGLRSALLAIAMDFKQYVDVEFTAVDVVITGSQAGYTYTEHSDLDLHIIVNYSEIDCDRELEELFDTKRHLYNHQRKITIHGIPVEIYVEDLNQPAQGPAYSLGLNRWLRPPESPQKIPPIDSSKILAAVKMWHKIITHAIDSKDSEILKKTQKLLKNYRVLGLKKQGEFSTANLVYKTLRNQKILVKLAQASDLAQSRKLSVV